MTFSDSLPKLSFQTFQKGKFLAGEMLFPPNA
jgi:hypothetical protein